MTTVMHFVATTAGFLIFDSETHHYDVHPDCRMASHFWSFAEADHHAKRAVTILFGRINQYYNILITAPKQVAS